MEQIFDSGPFFWVMTPNYPKMAQNTKIVTTLKAPFYCCAAVAPIRSLIALVSILNLSMSHQDKLIIHKTMNHQGCSLTTSILFYRPP